MAFLLDDRPPSVWFVDPIAVVLAAFSVSAATVIWYMVVLATKGKGRPMRLGAGFWYLAASAVGLILLAILQFLIEVPLSNLE